MAPAESNAEQPSEQLGIWAQAPGLVFLGVQLVWRPKLTDFAMANSFSEKWESRFASWKIEGRNIDLDAPSEGYAVRLGDGLAAFSMESATAAERGRKDFEEVFESVPSQGRSLRIDAQYLHPVSEEFDSLVKRLHSKLFTNIVLETSGTKLSDFAYLADYDRDGLRVQLSIGAVRGREIRQRVHARNLANIPEVATFYRILGLKPIKRTKDEWGTILGEVFSFGKSIDRSLLS